MKIRRILEGRVVAAGEVVRMLELEHDVLGQRPPQPFGAFP
jgi:hypothetical protein